MNIRLFALALLTVIPMGIASAQTAGSTDDRNRQGINPDNGTIGNNGTFGSPSVTRPSTNNNSMSTSSSTTMSDTNTTSATATSHGRVTQVQRALNSKGYSVTVDGAMGPETRRALRSFQAAQNINQSGTLDSSTLGALGVTGDDFDRAPASVPSAPVRGEAEMSSTPDSDRD